MNHLHLLFAIFATSFASKKKCMYIDYNGSKQNSTECTNNTVCARNFIVSHIMNLPPYSTAPLLEPIIRKCCGPCTNLTHLKRFKNISEVSLSEMPLSDFIMPVLGSSSATDLYGYHFLPIVNVPGVFYFTARYRSLVTELCVQCLKLYPLVIICILMAIISGFMAWCIETKSNEEQFPRDFLTGLFEGFWWSFVTMTTVGYGDKSVRSVAARLLAVVWIIVGITMFGLMTGLMTGEIMKAANPHEHIRIAGARVGVLQFREYDAALISKHGGIIKETSAWNFHADVFMLLEMLRKEEVNGVVFDKYTLAYISEYFKWKRDEKSVDYLISGNASVGERYEERKADIEFFDKYTLRTPQTYDGEKLAYGVLVKDADVYGYLKDAVRDNRLSLETSVGSEMNELFKRKPVSIISSFGDYKNWIVMIAVILCAIGLYGLLYELYLRKKVACCLYYGKTPPASSCAV